MEILEYLIYAVATLTLFYVAGKAIKSSKKKVNDLDISRNRGEAFRSRNVK